MTDFARARLDDLERYVRLNFFDGDMVMYSKSIAMIESQRMVVDLHEKFPTMVQSPMKYEPNVFEDFDINSITMRASQQIVFLTNQAYYAQFGHEAPTMPFMREFLKQFQTHPDFQQEWIS